MGLNTSKGDMYPFITHTWNVIKGVCPHACHYCYMKGVVKKDLYFAKSELKTDLGSGNFIFVGSSCDMWADAVPEGWIMLTLDHCRKYPHNRYLFQSKNPYQIMRLRQWLPKCSIIGTTIETNRQYPQMGKAPIPEHRMSLLHLMYTEDFKTMVTIEPIMKFDLNELLYLVCTCNPEWVNIGADSKRYNLPEPTANEIKTLIEKLQGYKIEVKVKKNLKRLLT